MTPDLPESLEALRWHVAGKSVLLVGSAPGVDISGSTADVTVMINGAALGVPGAALPHILMINTGIAACNSAGLPTRHNLATLSCKLLLTIESGVTIDFAKPVF